MVAAGLRRKWMESEICELTGAMKRGLFVNNRHGIRRMRAPTRSAVSIREADDLAITGDGFHCGEHYESLTRNPPRPGVRFW